MAATMPILTESDVRQEITAITTQPHALTEEEKQQLEFLENELTRRAF